MLCGALFLLGFLLGLACWPIVAALLFIGPTRSRSHGSRPSTATFPRHAQPDEEVLVLLGRLERAVVRPPMMKLPAAEIRRLKGALRVARITTEGAFGLAA